VRHRSRPFRISSAHALGRATKSRERTPNLRRSRRPLSHSPRRRHPLLQQSSSARWARGARLSRRGGPPCSRCCLACSKRQPSTGLHRRARPNPESAHSASPRESPGQLRLHWYDRGGDPTAETARTAEEHMGAVTAAGCRSMRGASRDSPPHAAQQTDTTRALTPSLNTRLIQLQSSRLIDRYTPVLSPYGHLAVDDLRDAVARSDRKTPLRWARQFAERQSSL